MRGEDTSIEGKKGGGFSPTRGRGPSSVLLATAVGIALTTTAQAACPTGADLKNGILVKNSVGNTELHRRTTPNNIQITVTFDDGDGSVLDMLHGIYMVQAIDTEQGVLKLSTRVRLVSRAATRAWIAPKPNAQWRNPARKGGGSAQSGPVKQMKIGACQYNSIEVALRYSDDPTYWESYAYLPDLGIGLLVGSDDGTTRERYRYTAISKH